MERYLAIGLAVLLITGCTPRQALIETNEQRLLADSQRCNQAAMVQTPQPTPLSNAHPGKRSHNTYFMCMRSLGW